MATDKYRKTLENQKSASMLQLLFKTARLGNEWALARMAEKRPDLPPMRASHTSLLPHLDLEGTRLTTLAERIGVSKQAISQVVEDLETADIVRREPDPSDGRAKLVRFTENGLQSLLAGLEHLKSLEAELAQIVGQQRIDETAATLREILDYLDALEDKSSK